MPDSATSASRMMRASWMSFVGEPIHVIDAHRFHVGSGAFIGCANLAAFLAASYSSARRHLLLEMGESEHILCGWQTSALQWKSPHPMAPSLFRGGGGSAQGCRCRGQKR